MQSQSAISADTQIHVYPLPPASHAGTLEGPGLGFSIIMEATAWCLSIKKICLHGFYPVAEYDISYLLRKGLCKSQCLKPAVLRHSAGPPWHREGTGASRLFVKVGASCGGEAGRRDQSCR